MIKGCRRHSLSLHESTLQWPRYWPISPSHRSRNTQPWPSRSIWVLSSCLASPDTGLTISYFRTYPKTVATPGAKTINVFWACFGAQLTICAQKWRNFVLFSTVSLRFVLSRVCVFLYSLVPCTYIYVHRLCDRNMGLLPASNRHFTVSPHEVFTCFRSAWHPLHQMFTNRKKVEFTRSCPLFLASFGKLRLSDQVQFIAWHGIQRQIIWIFWRESEVSG